MLSYWDKAVKNTFDCILKIFNKQESLEWIVFCPVILAWVFLSFKWLTCIWSSLKHFQNYQEVKNCPLQGKQFQSSAFHSSPKYLKEWGSVGPLKLNASHQKSKLSPRIFTCNLTILWITTCLYVFFAQTASIVVLTITDIPFINRGSSIYFQLKILITGNLGILNILNGAHQTEICFGVIQVHIRWKKISSLHKEEILVVSCSSMLRRKHPNSSSPSLTLGD